ncbi:MAG TPA: 5-formyltetrahydrofolate cyclo-ligase [Caulobacteraceae bacterium]|jgi:5-formyltetrahydrofolate cyclo-ligase|nr:5-formyltetrahydrofolate cyclo-ligase [Caulobacteraceae bacterium]
MDPTPTKSDLRIAAEARRALAHGVDAAVGEALAAAFPDDLFPEAGRVASAYWPYRTEIDSRPLMARLAAAGVRIALPVTPARGSDQALTFRIWSEGDHLSPGHFPVHEPHPDAEVALPDLVLVPLLAFDRTGHRLGYGAGHYDRTLQHLRALKPVQAIGLAFADQAVERLPAGPHDQRLDGILTERGYIPAVDIA